MKRLCVLSLIAWLAACASSGAPAPAATPPLSIVTPSSPMEPPGRELIVEPIQIDQVEVQIAGSWPVQVSARVTGVIGDGCSSVRPVIQQREGNTITLTINRQRPANAICTQIAKLYEEIIRLDGNFPADAYVLKVNDVTRTFTIG